MIFLFNCLLFFQISTGRLHKYAGKGNKICESVFFQKMNPLIVRGLTDITVYFLKRW